MKNVRRSLLTSSVSLLLCFVMLIGTTFAWFTDVATSANNIIKTGNLDVSMYWNTDNGTEWKNAEGINADPIFDYHNWEPGYTEVRYIKVKNEGNLAFQYRMYIDPTGVVGELADVIDVYYDVVTDNNGFAVPVSFSNMGSLQRLGTLRNVISEDISIPGGVLLPAGETENGCYSGEVVICVAFHMQESANNHYQGESIGDSFGITLHATQYSYEKDSFGTEYDSDAQWPERPINLYATKNINGTPLVYGELANEVAINGDKISATIPAGVKIAENATTLNLTVESTETDANLSLSEDASARGFDVHITGIAADNTQPMIVNLGAVLPAGIAATELKLYHTENGTPVQMTRVASTADFARHNHYVYNEATGEVSIYVASFSTFSMVKSVASKWEDNTVADTSWYVGHENNDEFILEDVADFLGFRDLVDAGTTFAGKTVTLDTDIDLAGKLFNPIGGGWAYNGGKTFNGTFNGGNHTIYNIYVNGWELDATGDKHSSTSMGAGLFSSIHNATIKNLVISGADMRVETTSIGVVVGCAQGKCTFSNIVVTNATLGNYQMRNGGIVGDIYVIESDNVTAEYSHTFTNIVVDSSVKLVSMWGDFDTGNGGVIGGKYGSAKVLMQNVIVACELDVFSDVTAAYQWYAYRRCGMLIGYTGQNSPKQATNASADFLTCENVNVYYGDWVNYTYYQFTNQDSSWQSNYPWVRAQESVYNGAFSNVRYGNPVVSGVAINTPELAEANKTGYAAITFNQLYGGGQGVYGTNEHEGKGVTIYNTLKKTIRIKKDIAGWENLKIYYWFANGDDTWTNLIDGVDMNSIGNNVYQIDIPAYAHGFRITDGNNQTEEFLVEDVANGETYSLKDITTDRVIYFDNHNNWKNVNLYYRNAATSGDYEAISASATNGVYTVTLPKFAKSIYFGDANSNAKTHETTTLTNGHIYIDNGTAINSCEYVEGYKTVYFLNNWLWTEPQYSYMGVAIDMEYVNQEGTYKLYSFALPNYVTEFKVLNKGGEESTMIDYESVKDDGSIYSMFYDQTTKKKQFVECVKIYLKPNSWTRDNAWFAAYIWNGDEDGVWFKMNKDGDYYSCCVPKGYSKVIFTRMNPAKTDIDWGSKWNQTGDLTIPNDGNNCYVYTQFDTNKLYFKPNSNWKADSARFAAYFFGNGEKWVDMTDNDGDGIYECTIPSGYTKVIFCRMNGSTSANNWNNKWDQTNDLDISPDEKNIYTVAEGAWSNGNGSWSEGYWSKK